MNPPFDRLCLSLASLALLALAPPLQSATLVFETTSAYHHIHVFDDQGMRTLQFDNSVETRMCLATPGLGHFEYVDYFFAPWAWNPGLTNVLMIGLGGASAQQAFARYCPGVTIDSVEIDPAVVRVAKTYFRFQESPPQRVFVDDGRVFLQRSQARYGAVLVDAYVEGRYGASIPHHLATREFFELVRDRLTTNGVVAYNCMGTLQGWRANLVGALYRTMKEVFPTVCLFPARESLNVVLVGALAAERPSAALLVNRARPLLQAGRVRLPTLLQRLGAVRVDPPPNHERCPMLSDDYAPLDGLLADVRPSTRPTPARAGGSP